MFLKNPFKAGLLCLLLLAACPAFAQYSMSQQMRSNERAAYLNWLKYQKTKAEGGNLLKWWHEESTIGYVVATPVTFTNRIRYVDTVYYHAMPTYDSTVTSRLQTTFAFHANGNSNYMLYRLGPTSLVSFSAGLDLNFLLWKVTAFNGNQLTTDPNNDLVLVNIGVPLTIDYKSGCDVDFDPELKSCFAVGAGVIPMASCNYYNGQYVEWRTHLRPYVYASFGLYAWGCWKVRASFTPGRFLVFDHTQETYDAGLDKTLTAETSNLLSFGISRMTYSRDWKEGRAWRRGAGFGGGGRHHIRSNGRMF